MYQALHYSRETKKYLLRDCQRGWLEFPYRATCYIPDKNGDYKTLDGKRVSPTKNYTWKDPDVYESDVDRYTRVLVDAYYESDEVPSFQNIVFLDIECEMVGSITQDSVRNPAGKITSIALYDATTKTYYCYILDVSKQITSMEEGSKHIIACFTESELLERFLSKWQELDATIICGYNSVFFDIPYLYHRLCKVVGSKEALRLSPLREVDEGEFMNIKFTKIAGLNHLDYMLLFKKYITTQEPSYKLGDIGEKYVNLGKIEYLGSLTKLFKEDVHKFIDYNIRDVEILVALDEKQKFIDLTVGICHLCHVPYEQIYLSTALNEGAILTYLKRKDIVSPNKPTTYNPALQNEKEEYAGGYLKDPVPGLYEWLEDIDFTSLYPSIIRSLNMGIETLVGRIVNRGKYDNQWTMKELRGMDPETSITIERIDDRRNVSRSTSTVGKILQLIIQENWTISAPGVIFRTDRKSVVCEVLTDWFNKRAEYKKLMKIAYKSGDKAKGEFYNRNQQVFKIKLVDLYGSYAINGWRYSDGNKFISKAITLTGQRVLQESITNMNEYLNKQLGTEGIDRIVTGDTDSLFVHIKDLLLYRHPGINLKNREEVIPLALKLATEIQNEANRFIDIFAKDAFNLGGHPHYFDLKQEVILERGYFAGKRRYAQFIVNKEGVPVEELDIKGLDLMKSNFPKYFKTFGKGVIHDIMFGKPKSEIDKRLIEFRESINTVDWRMLLKPTGLKNVESYISCPPRAGEIFSKLMSGCPINSRSAIIYSDLLRFKKLDKKYNTFQPGDKMFIAYLKDNPYKVNVIGFNGYDDPPFITEFIEKYIDKQQMFDSVMKNKIESLYKDIGWGQPIFNPSINKFFSFK